MTNPKRPEQWKPEEFLLLLYLRGVKGILAHEVADILTRRDTDRMFDVMRVRNKATRSKMPSMGSSLEEQMRNVIQANGISVAALRGSMAVADRTLLDGLEKYEQPASPMSGKIFPMELADGLQPEFYLESSE